MKYEWQECTIGDLGQIVTGKTPPTKNNEYWGGKVMFITPKDIQASKHIFKTERYVTDEGKVAVRGAILPKGSICVSCIGNIGYLGITTEECISNQQINSIIVNENNDIDFVYYLLKSLWAYFKNYEGQSTALSILNKTQFSKIKVQIPNIGVQKKISGVLKMLDEKIELNNAINNNLEQQIEAILLSFIENTNSNNVKLGDYLYIKGRIGWKGLKKDEYLEHSDFRIINGESLTKAGIDWSKAGYISQSRYDESPEIMLKNGDILLSKDGTIGKIGYIDSLSAPTTVASGIFVIRNIQPNIISTTFIYYLLKSRLFTAFITARTEGSVIPHLYQKDFMQFEFPLPSKDEMASFEELTAPMFSLIVSNLNENDRLTRLRDSLLPRLMSGELDVSDINI